MAPAPNSSSSGWLRLRMAPAPDGSGSGRLRLRMAPTPDGSRIRMAPVLPGSGSAILYLFVIVVLLLVELHGAAELLQEGQTEARLLLRTPSA